MRSGVTLGLIAASFICVAQVEAQDWQTGVGGAIGGGAGAAVGSAVGGRTGAAVGGALGGAAGGVIGHDTGGTAGAAIGGAIGGGAGAMIGSSVTGSDAKTRAPIQTTTSPTTQPQPAPRVEAPVREVHHHHYYDEGPAKKHKKKHVPRGNAYGWHRNHGD